MSKAASKTSARPAAIRSRYARVHEYGTAPKVPASQVKELPRAEDILVDDFLHVGWLRWRRSSLNCFVGDLPRARLEVRRHVAWKKRPTPTPWRIVNVFGWCPFGEDRCFATPEEAMERAGELALNAIGGLHKAVARAVLRGDLHRG